MVQLLHWTWAVGHGPKHMANTECWNHIVSNRMPERMSECIVYIYIHIHATKIHRVCQIECQIWSEIVRMPCIPPDSMSETIANLVVRVGITPGKILFWATVEYCWYVWNVVQPILQPFSRRRPQNCHTHNMVTTFPLHLSSLVAFYMVIQRRYHPNKSKYWLYVYIYD